MKSYFPKHDLRSWHWHYNIDFWIDAYRVLKKKSSSYIMYICAYVRVYIHIYCFSKGDVHQIIYSVNAGDLVFWSENKVVNYIKEHFNKNI